MRNTRGHCGFELVPQTFEELLNIERLIDNIPSSICEWLENYWRVLGDIEGLNRCGLGDIIEGELIPHIVEFFKNPTKTFEDLPEWLYLTQYSNDHDVIELMRSALRIKANFL